MVTDSSPLATLLAKQEIAEVLFRYCLGCDHSDEAVLRSCFHPDSTHDHAGFVGATSDWIPAALAWLRDRTSVTHIVTNVLIEIRGDSAVSNCHFLAYNRLAASEAEPPSELLVKGRYVDSFERRAGAWKIRHRVGLHDLERVFMPPGPAPATAGSQKMANDPYYAMLAQLRA